MASAINMDNPNGLNDFRWGQMMTLSIIFHVFIFGVVIVLPGSMPSRRVKDIVYQVNLVEMPLPEKRGTKTTSNSSTKKTDKIISLKNSQAKRIPTEKMAKQPLVISKRTTKKRSSQIKKPDMSSSQRIDQAISRIERSVESEENSSSQIEDAISRLEEEVSQEGALSPQTGGSRGGVSMNIYQMEVETRIKRNWAYPTALRNQKDVKAVVEIRVKRDGTVLNFKFLTSSSDSLFDNSIIKAIEKSKPLPPFPENYRENYDDIEITFHSEDL